MSQKEGNKVLGYISEVKGPDWSGSVGMTQNQFLNSPPWYCRLTLYGLEFAQNEMNFSFHTTLVIHVLVRER